MTEAADETVAVHHTHIYPGAKGRYGAVGTPSEDGTDVGVEFSDGVVAQAVLYPLPGGRRLMEVNPYVTAAGHSIPSKVWILERDGEDDAAAFRVRDHGEPAGPRRRRR